MSSDEERRTGERAVIARTMTAISRCQSVDEICTLLGSTVHRFNEDAYVVVSIFDEKRGGIRIRDSFGSGDMMDSLLHLFDRDPRLMAFSAEDMLPEERRLFTSGKLERVPGGVHAALARKVPEGLCRTAEALLGVDGVYAVGFALDEDPYGGLFVLPPEGQAVRHIEAIETLVAHAAVVVRRHQAEEALRESEERYRILVDNQGEGIGFVDSQERFTFANPAAHEIFGVASGDLIGRSLREFVDEETFALFQRQTALRREGKKSTYEVEIERPDQERRTLLVTGVPRFDSEDKFIGTVGIFRDITERVRAEKRRRELEEQLQAARRLESIGQLAGGVAHDFNNLLTPIMGYAQFIREKLAPDDPLQGDVKEIRSAASRARDLVRQLLAFGRRQMLQVKPLDLNETVSELEAFLQRTIRENIDIRLELEPSLGRVRADAGQMEQILMNLASNAQDAMPDGGKMTIRTENVYLDAAYTRERADVEEGHYVMLSLSDTGVGMTEEVQEHLFEPFFTTKEVGEGTGMGLATVYGIVKQHGGSIYVHSEEGAGSTFKIYLPRIDEAALEGEGALPLAEPEEQEGDDLLLVVENNDMVRGLARRVLERSGYDVLTARSGIEALQLLEEYDGTLRLLLTDVVMPTTDGKALFRRLRQRYPQLKVLYVSGYGDGKIGDLDRSQGEVGFLSKPFAMADLQRAVRDLLD